MSFEKLMNCGPGISHGDGGWGGSVGGDAYGMNNERHIHAVLRTAYQLSDIIKFTKITN